MSLMKKRIFAAVMVLAFGVLAAQGQIVPANAPSRFITKADPVQYMFPAQVSVTAGKPSPVALHFSIAQGLHINSHTPSDEYLIPTAFSIPDGAGVRLDSATYPAGIVMALPADPKTKLSVYTGEFTIEARFVATAGNHLVEGKLRYQACDQSQCLPPRTITVPIKVIAR
jgi:Thiol:disulfide interchange protein DsbD, N-terminal